jgi:hypothetical protein
MHEYTKQLTGKECNKTISRDSTPKQDEMVRNRDEDEKYRDNQLIILDQEADHSYRRKRRPPTINEDFFMGKKLKSYKPLINMTKHTKESLVLIHQNIRGLAGKTDELNCSIVSKNMNPHLIRISEHHMSDLKLSYSNLQNYVLGTMYSRTTHQGGGVCIYIRSDIKFIAINLEQFCDEKNLEICALKITTAKTNILVICIYRSP